MPSTRSIPRAVGACVALAFVGTVTAQSGVGDPGSGSVAVDLTFSFVGGVVVNLVLAGILVAVAPEYAGDTIAEIRDDPGDAVVWGLLVSIGGLVAVVVLAITIIGILVAIPLALVLAAVSVAGTAVAVVLVGALLTDSERPSGTAVLAGSLAVGLMGAIPVIGGLATWVVTLPGVGVVGHDLYRSVRG
ncbi:hypothetical protein Hbl1158_09995 [Halobaculum sp. CBA1158]|uniref:hypothetical protein n=1 Tax=Halobaculum sp. CBA1158 TaxID=2904243 RepID=UPI001F459617|nr:hypothetical protein [Halobaculum sp. CBA1158]UIO98865.1 hypothetical protein Hbl1158_09995 [Halobaculum sp. CBA1158]